MATFHAWAPEQSRLYGKPLCWASCHQWAGGDARSRGALVCMDCGARVEAPTEAQFANAPRCRIRLVPVSWLPRAPVAFN